MPRDSEERPDNVATRQVLRGCRDRLGDRDPAAAAVDPDLADRARPARGAGRRVLHARRVAARPAPQDPAPAARPLTWGRPRPVRPARRGRGRPGPGCAAGRARAPGQAASVPASPWRMRWVTFRSAMKETNGIVPASSTKSRYPIGQRALSTPRLNAAARYTM